MTTDETGFGARMLLMAGVFSPYFADGPLYPTAGMPVAFAAGDLDGEKDGGSAGSSAMYVFSFPAIFASGVPDTDPDLPATARTELLPNYPNPFNPLTEISFRLTRDAHAVLCVYDTRGRLVTTLVDGVLAAGEHSVRFDGRGLASGMYLGRLEADGVVQTRKMMLVR